MSTTIQSPAAAEIARLNAAKRNIERFGTPIDENFAQAAKQSIEEGRQVNKLVDEAVNEFRAGRTDAGYAKLSAAVLQADVSVDIEAQVDTLAATVAQRPLSARDKQTLENLRKQVHTVADEAQDRALVVARSAYGLRNPLGAARNSAKHANSAIEQARTAVFHLSDAKHAQVATALESAQALGDKAIRSMALARVMADRGNARALESPAARDANKRLERSVKLVGGASELVEMSKTARTKSTKAKALAHQALWEHALGHNRESRELRIAARRSLAVATGALEHSSDTARSIRGLVGRDAEHPNATGAIIVGLTERYDAASRDVAIVDAYIRRVNG